VPIDIALPRTEVGYISERRTQITGPKEKAKQAMKISMKRSNKKLSVRLSAKRKPITINENTIPETPNNKRGLLPKLSIFQIAINVKATLIIPIIT